MAGEEAAGLEMLGTGLGMFGNIYQGNLNANLARYNAEIADQNAYQVIAQGNEIARRALVQARKFVGAEGAAYGASGVTNDGSAEWVMRDSVAQGTLNALTIKNAAEIKATAYRNEAALDRFRAGNQEFAGYLGAASSLLSGSSKVASNYGGDYGEE